MDASQYLGSNIRIGFTDYVVGEERETVRYKTYCRRFPVEVDVSLASVQFDGYHVTCAVTSRVDISSNLPFNGFNSYCHQDEAKVMESAIWQYCKDNGLMICRKENSWPYALAVVQKQFGGQG